MAGTASGHIRVNMRVEGGRQVLKAMNGLPKFANAELRSASLHIAELLAGEMRSAAMSQGPVAAKLATTVKARRDRIPSVFIGGPRRLFRGEKDGTEKEAFQLLFASEFGCDSRGDLFKPHAGQRGYWIFPTVRANEAQIGQAWKAVADAIVERYERESRP